METTSKANGAAKRFELLSFDFHFGSLTDGTDIPPPELSPVREEPPPVVPTPPKTPVSEDDASIKASSSLKPEAVHSNDSNGHDHSPSSDYTSATLDNLKPPVEGGPSSPTQSAGHGSLRRLLSRSLLNPAHEEHASTSQGESRPPSRTTSVATEERKSRRGSGWFKRLRQRDSSNPNKRNTIQFTPSQFEHFKEPEPEPEPEPVKVEKPKGPPPPMIPDLNTWGTKVDTKIGDDLFSAIK